MRIMILLFALLIASQGHAQAWKYKKTFDKLTDQYLFSTAKIHGSDLDLYFSCSLESMSFGVTTADPFIREEHSGFFKLAFRVDKSPPKYYTANTFNHREFVISQVLNIKLDDPLVQDMLKGQKIYVRVKPGLDRDSPDYSYFFADEELSLEKSAVQIKKVFSDCNQPLP